MYIIISSQQPKKIPVQSSAIPKHFGSSTNLSPEVGLTWYWLDLI